MHLKKYLNSRNDLNEALFVGERDPHARLGRRAIQRVFNLLGERAGVPKSVYPHLSNMKSLAAIETERLIKEFRTIAQDVDEKAFKAGYDARQQEIKNYFKQTERRLYSYIDLKNNIDKYNMDIDDLRREKITTRYKDIVRMPEGIGIRLTPEEIQEAKILNLQNRRDRDLKEIRDIDKALDSIKNDSYYMVIEYKYFEGKSDELISELMNCDVSTVRRHKSQLVVHRIAVKLYGADAIN